MRNKILKYTLRIVAFLIGTIAVTGCDDSKSYADLLRDENAAVNWYLAQNRVVAHVPADSVFEVGEDAPFYRMNAEGNVYMRVLNAGDMTRRPKKGETVYIRFMRYDINAMYEGNPTSGAGNSENMGLNSVSFIYGNTTLTSTTQMGTGIQVPLGYLGYDCEVDLIVKSTEGFTDGISNCIAYVYKGLKYFKAEY